MSEMQNALKELKKLVKKIKARNDKMLYLVDLGIVTDGADHKQWCLIEIAKLLNMDISDVDKGIEP